MPFLSSFSGHTPDGFVQRKAGNFLMSLSGNETSKNKPYKDDWDVDRAVKDALERVVWVNRAVFAIASNAARLPIIRRADDPRNGEVLEPTYVTEMLNRHPNQYQDAYSFRFMISEQVLICKSGAFVEKIRNRMGDVIALELLPPGKTSPIPGEKEFVESFLVDLGYGKTRKVDAQDVIWIRIPHPTNPYMGQTPLQAAGLAVEFDYYARVYNRNFVVNDGRPGGILVLNGELGDDDAEEVQRRFKGSTGSNIGGAGRLTVMSADSATYIDTTTKQRDAQYLEARMANKEEILLAFGVPEVIIGNASGRTFSNADVETSIFWRETMLPHLTLLERALDVLDEFPKSFISHDLSSVAVLDRDARERAAYHLDELKQGAISIDEYRGLTGRAPKGIDGLLVPTNLSPVMMGGDTQPTQEAPEEDMSPTNRVNPAQRPGRPSGNNQEPPENIARQGDAVTPPTVPLNPAPMTERSGAEIPESKDYNQVAEKRYRHIKRLETSVGLQVTSFLKRQSRVVMEKANSKKIKEKVAAGETITVSDIFDRSVWDSQLLDDAKTWISAIVIDGAVEIAGSKSGELGIDLNNQEILTIIDTHMGRIKSINESTENAITELINAKLPEGHKAFVEILADWFEKSITNRTASIARTEVVAAFNSGMVWSAKQLGFSKKTWLTVDNSSRHSDLMHKTIDINEEFSLGESKAFYPGDVNASPEFTINCRCTLDFS